MLLVEWAREWFLGRRRVSVRVHRAVFVGTSTVMAASRWWIIVGPSTVLGFAARHKRASVNRVAHLRNAAESRDSARCGETLGHLVASQVPSGRTARLEPLPLLERGRASLTGSRDGSHTSSGILLSGLKSIFQTSSSNNSPF